MPRTSFHWWSHARCDRRGRPAVGAAVSARCARSAAARARQLRARARRVASLVEAVRRAAPRVRVLATSQENLWSLANRCSGCLHSPLPTRLRERCTLGRGRAVRRARAGATARSFSRRRTSPPWSRSAVASTASRSRSNWPRALPLFGVERVRARLNERFRVLTGARGSRRAGIKRCTRRSTGATTCCQSLSRRCSGDSACSSARFHSTRAARGGRRPVDRWAVLDHLGVLVDKSLVIAEGRTAPRYRLLETGRAFALEKLEQAGETDDLLRATRGRCAR